MIWFSLLCQGTQVAQSGNLGHPAPSRISALGIPFNSSKVEARVPDLACVCPQQMYSPGATGEGFDSPVLCGRTLSVGQVISLRHAESLAAQSDRQWHPYPPSLRGHASIASGTRRLSPETQTIIHLEEGERIHEKLRNGLGPASFERPDPRDSGAVRGGPLFGSLRRCHDAAAITERQPDENAPLSARES